MRWLALGIGLALASGCGDRCDRLCVDVSRDLATCKTDAVTWPDLGATSRIDFLQTCQDDWDALRTDLDARGVELALDVCEDSSDTLEELTCEELVALYAP